MLQQFYKETLQSLYIKYILNNTHIPTIPFTSNILHITKGNTYIHDGYIVTAKKSDAVAAVIEDINTNKLKYNEIFIRHEPYVFGRLYNGLTTKYKSNTKGYDSETHYYLGEYLRAYKAHYKIDLMPFYNCFSNEYIDYLTLSIDTDDRTKVTYHLSTNKNYKIISVPIKFCQKYSISLQCNSEILLLPVFIGNKGLLEDATKQLYTLNYWGKQLPLSYFNKPFIYESPHINSVNDTTQALLQNYDKYLRLLIQIPVNTKTSIVILEGEYSNSKTFSKKIINTSIDDILELWEEYYDTKIPSKDYFIDIPKDSELICDNIENYEILLSKLDNDYYYNILNFKNNNGRLAFKITGINYDTIDIFDKIDKGNYEIVNYSWLDVEGKTILFPDNSIKIEDNKLLVPYNVAVDEIGEIAYITNDNGDKIKSIKYMIENGKKVKFYNYEYLSPSPLSHLRYLKDIDIGSADIIIGGDTSPTTFNKLNNKIIIKLPKVIEGTNIQLNDDISLNNKNSWSLKSKIYVSNLDKNNKITQYLNKNMISNLSLLKFNDGVSYGFCDRLIEYLTNNVISNIDTITDNVKRVQESPLINTISNGLWDNSLRAKVYNKVIEKINNRAQFPLYDINGFVDKDSEKILVIDNELFEDKKKDNTY